jgi:acyl-CoA synthetase (AMP-forming)/AMP-acid ligase II
MAYQQEGDLVIETIDPAALQALCGRKLARYKRPATIVVVDAIPKNPVGKTDKKYADAARAVRAVAARPEPDPLPVLGSRSPRPPERGQR